MDLKLAACIILLIVGAFLGLISYLTTPDYDLRYDDKQEALKKREGCIALGVSLCILASIGIYLQG